jgi:hypothetical protein
MCLRARGDRVSRTEAERRRRRGRRRKKRRRGACEAGAGEAESAARVPAGRCPVCAVMSQGGRSPWGKATRTRSEMTDDLILRASARRDGVRHGDDQVAQLVVGAAVGRTVCMA